MKRRSGIPWIILLVILGLPLSSLAQESLFSPTRLDRIDINRPFPAGGCQDGLHGNAQEMTWTGAVDEKWSVAENWCPPGIPGEKVDVVIPAAVPNMPEVKVQGMKCRDITINPGATLTTQPGITLTVNGQITIQ